MSDEGIGGYIVVALLAGGIVYSCTDREKHSNLTSSSAQPAYILPQDAPVPSDQPSLIPTPLPPPKPAHFYESAEGSTYYYGAAVSDDDRKSGKHAPDMIAFWYLGRDAKGNDRIQRVIDGVGRWISTCARPCKVIHNDDGTATGFDEGSIIGAAFADAQRGFLKKHVLPNAKVVPNDQWPGTPVPPAPEPQEE